jgi:hypothetical protein
LKSNWLYNRKLRLKEIRDELGNLLKKKQSEWTREDHELFAFATNSKIIQTKKA